MPRVRVTPKVNGYSAAPVPAAGRIPKVRPPLRTLARIVQAGPTGTTKKAGEQHEAATKSLAEAQSDATYARGARARRRDFDASGGRPERLDELPATPIGHGMTLHDLSAQSMLRAGVSGAHTLDMVRGTHAMADPHHAGTELAGSGEKVPRTVAQGTPNINEPHETNPNVIPSRRWEDLHPAEQARALAIVHKYGSSPEQMESDLRAQVLSAHQRAARNGVATPWSARFYEGPSLQHTKIEEGADEVQRESPSIPRDHARAMVATVNAATSPNTKFQQGNRFPNHEAAMHALAHGMAGGEPEEVGRPEGVGGVYPANLEKAAHLARQMSMGVTTPDVKLQSGKTAFDPTHAPKTTDYLGAWVDPTGPDSRYVSDLHSTHSLMPHLSTAKALAHDMPDGTRVNVRPFDKVPKGAVQVTKEKDGKQVPVTAYSESEQYLASDRSGLHALHDHIARKVATDLGLSHTVDNAGATHFLQASDWGEEQINRPDITDRTEKTAYGRDERLSHPGHDVRYRTPSSGGVVVEHPDKLGEQHVASPFHVLKYGDSPSSQPRVDTPSRTAHFSDGATPEEPVGRDRERAEYGIAGVARKKAKKHGTSWPEPQADNPWWQS